MAEIDFVAPPKIVAVTVALEPVYSILDSFGLLTGCEHYPGMDDWVEQTASAMSPERRHTHELIFGSLYGVAVPEQGNWPSFPAYLEDLAAEDPDAMRDRALHKICCKKGSDGEEPDPAVLLADVEAYLAHVESVYRAKDALDHFDRSLYEKAHALLNDPPAMKALLVSHVRTMWEEVMAPEWARVEPMLRESVAAFQKLDHAGQTTAEIFRTITGRPVPDEWGEYIGKAEHIIFTPSAHIGPYLTMSVQDEAVRVTFGARIPEGVRPSSPTLSRSELLMRLGALADDTRLRILHLLSAEEELRVQDFIERLDLSQSATSRHLRQLVATGYLSERRRDGAKCYSLNRERLDDTSRALNQFLH